MTHIFSLSSESVHVSDFSLKSMIKAFIRHCEHHDIPAGEFLLTEFKASHDEIRGAWEEKTDQLVWVDPSEGLEAIYEVLKNV